MLCPDLSKLVGLLDYYYSETAEHINSFWHTDNSPLILLCVRMEIEYLQLMELLSEALFQSLDYKNFATARHPFRCVFSGREVEYCDKHLSVCLLRHVRRE